MYFNANETSGSPNIIERSDILYMLVTIYFYFNLFWDEKEIYRTIQDRVQIRYDRQRTKVLQKSKLNFPPFSPAWPLMYRPVASCLRAM
jgi:hypothetical protein